MTAKEMFKELGYEKSEDLQGIKYVLKIETTYEYTNIISFIVDGKIVDFSHYDSFEDSESGLSINMYELKAVIQQCKEFGWLDD